MVVWYVIHPSQYSFRIFENYDEQSVIDIKIDPIKIQTLKINIQRTVDLKI